ncbi:MULTISPECIES: hypothetical protein [unclassified Pseudomonas]|uniref:hypothetical protein n=1 Tax=unclassified Pseudomonas TaxID=196821 RepID=UPI002E82399D|nr:MULTISPECIES: hypothetical protein [unclassified Pseudomonas]
MLKVVIVICLLAMAGCAITNPVGDTVDSLKGRNIEEAIPLVSGMMRSGFKYPLIMSTNHETITEYLASYSSPDPDGYAKFNWQTDRSFYESTSTGSYMDTSQGRPILVNTYQPKRIPAACTVTLKVDRQGVIQSSDASGCSSIVPMSQVLFGQ